MEEPAVSIPCKVISVHPSFDAYGSEYVCVEFGIEAQKPPTVMSLPANLPQEASFIIPILSQLPKLMPQAKTYSKRLALYFTVEEWDRLPRKYQFGDEVEIRVMRDGTINIIFV
ncbi:MAG: arcadin 1 [Candidatus Hecatellaceae archaeon]